MKWNGLIEEFQEFLPVNESTPKLTLNEGNTPLIHLAKLSEKLGIELHVKTEGVNPTGSFKDRGMVMAVQRQKKKAMIRSCVLRQGILLQRQRLMLLVLI